MVRGLALKGAALAVAIGLAACGQQAGAPGGGGPTAPDGSQPGQIAPGSLRTDAQMEKDRQALIASMGAAAAPEMAAQFAGEFEAASEEPPWELTITNEFISFRRANLEPIEGRPTKRDVRANGLLIETEELVATIRAGECTFESGGKFPFTATVFWNGATFEGCARQATAAEGGVNQGWSVIVPRILPAIDACLQRADAKPARVTIAYPAENGTDVSVRLVEADNGRAECVVAPDGSAIRSYEGLSDRDVFRGERDPLFTRAPTRPPAGRCDDSTEIVGAGGPVGWLTRQKC